MRLSALARRRADLADQSCERLLAGLGATGQPGLQLGVLDVEEALDEHEPTLVEGVEVRVQIAGEEDVELAGPAPRAPADPREASMALGLRFAHGACPPRPLAQSARETIMRLMSAIALAGLSPFGQVRVQFMIVWQR